MSSQQIDFTVDSELGEEERERILETFRDPVRTTEQATGNSSRWSDARHMREHFGIPSWDPSVYDHQDVWPDLLVKEWDTGPDRFEGGTDVLAKGKPGSGKSSFANYISVKDLEVNRSKVVWRGSSSRSEWMPLAPYATLCLPKGCEIDARLESKIPTEPAVSLDLDELERIVRDVRFYENPMDLNREILEPGQFHVVYPDPMMRGCEQIYQRSAEKSYDLPEGRESLFAPEDPAKHWWFAWVMARVEWGPHDWTTWICDEIGDICPQSARKDSFGTFQKVEMLKDLWVDARKFGLSIYGFGHSEQDIHQYIRHKMRWRIQMPTTANPTRASQVVGFESIPMNHDLTTHYQIGECLPYNERHFEQKVRWKPMPSGTDYKLKIEARA